MQMLITTPTVSRITTPTPIELALSTCCVKKSGAALAAPAVPPPASYSPVFTTIFIFLTYNVNTSFTDPQNSISMYYMYIIVKDGSP